MTMKRTLTALAAALALGLALPALAEEGHDHGTGHDHSKEKSHFDVKAPETVRDAWTLITAKVAESEAALAAAKLDDVHAAGEHLEAAVHTLEAKSDMVAEASKGKLASALKQLDKAVDELHHGAEDKKADVASAALSKLKGLLPLVEGLYPAGALK
ncbi:MAG: hypothetical protein ACT4N2_07350 [Hyphomicrobium sp.]